MSKEPSKATDKSVKIMQCDCKHLYQDNKYGNSMRVHNPTAKGYRRTVCAKEKS